MTRPVRRSAMLACQVVRERDFRLVARWSIDLSERGMLVTADAPVLTGEPLIVSFKSPFARAWIDAEATVARVIHARRQGDRKRALGLFFEDLDAASRACLATVLPWFRPIAPRPRPSG